MALLFEQESAAIIGACFEVHNSLGPGFLEAVYQESLKLEFQQKDISAVPQAKLQIRYKGISLNQFYEADFICFEKIIVEIKCVVNLADIHRAQVLNYLKATGYRLGILVNFQSHPKLQFERIVR